MVCLWSVILPKLERTEPELTLTRLGQHYRTRTRFGNTRGSDHGYNRGCPWQSLTSMSVLSSGPNNEWSKPALLVAIVGLWMSYFMSLVL